MRLLIIDALAHKYQQNQKPKSTTNTTQSQHYTPKQYISQTPRNIQNKTPQKKTLSAFIQALFNHPHTQNNIHKSPQNINRIFDSLPPPTAHKNHFHTTPAHTNAAQNYT